MDACFDGLCLLISCCRGRQMFFWANNVLKPGAKLLNNSLCAIHNSKLFSILTFFVDWSSFVDYHLCRHVLSISANSSHRMLFSSSSSLSRGSRLLFSVSCTVALPVASVRPQGLRFPVPVVQTPAFLCSSSFGVQPIARFYFFGRFGVSGWTVWICCPYSEGRSIRGIACSCLENP